MARDHNSQKCSFLLSFLLPSYPSPKPSLPTSRPERYGRPKVLVSYQEVSTPSTRPAQVGIQVHSSTTHAKSTKYVSTDLGSSRGDRRPPPPNSVSLRAAHHARSTTIHTTSSNLRGHRRLIARAVRCWYIVVTAQDRTGQGARLGAEPALRHTLPLRSVTMSCDSAPRLGQEHPTLPVLTATPPFTASPPTYPSSSSEPPTRCEMARSVRHVRKSECEEEKSLNFLPTTQPQPAGHKESQAPDEQVRRVMAMQDEECLYCVVTHKVLVGRLAPTSCLSPRPLVNTQAAAS